MTGNKCCQYNVQYDRQNKSLFSFNSTSILLRIIYVESCKDSLSFVLPKAKLEPHWHPSHYSYLIPHQYKICVSAALSEK